MERNVLTARVLDRRRFLEAAVGALVVAGGGFGLDRLLAGPGARPGLAAAPRGLPARQHAWNATLARDVHGNPVAPRFHRLQLIDLTRSPNAGDVRSLESALRALERTYPWGPHGLLFTVGWGPRYFERVIATRSPIPPPRALSDFELPTLDDYDLCLHLACDDEQRLAGIAARLAGRDAQDSLALGSGFAVRETRSGFVGARLPASHQSVAGIPQGRPVSAAAPLYMGFKSGYRRNQASEDSVTIPDGAFAGGTTMHVSRMRLRLDSWYGLLDERERVAHMFGPQVTPADVAHFTTDAPSHPALLDQAALRYGLVGHAQTSARARRHGRPRILRRDFNTIDGGEAGLHFVALQRTIEDFVATRTAMNSGNSALLNPAIGDTVNNGINEFIFVTRRANYIVPPRRDRSFPLLPGREAALA